MFCHFLKNLEEIDTGKEVPPRVDGYNLGLFAVDYD
jgi:hypothetical protein